jgi:DNA-binding NtrC family response regulator
MNESAEHPFILIVDDDLKGARLLRRGLEIANMEADIAETAERAIEKCLAGNFDAVLMDLNLPGMNGIEALREIHRERPFCPVIIITGHNEIHTAVQAIKQGAFDYLVKPLDLEHVRAVIRRALRESASARREEAVKRTGSLERIVHAPNSPLASVLQTAEKIATSNAPVLITGESGTGKELVARRIHQQSVRVHQPFIQVNCAAVPRDLLESEFFGHEKGAFTGATERREGLFSIANKGTLFLDEIGDIPPSMQGKLLRTLQSGELRKVGGNRIVHVDVRIIAATGKNLEQEVRTGRFREDLFYRLNVMRLLLPPLRERKQDIPPLVDYFLQTLPVGGRRFSDIEKQALERFLLHDWPGNVRELQNTIERLMLLGTGPILTLSDIRNDYTFRDRKNAPGASLDETLEELEARHILNMLERCDGNKTRAAARLGISVQTLYNKLNRMERKQ